MKLTPTQLAALAILDGTTDAKIAAPPDAIAEAHRLITLAAAATGANPLAEAIDRCEDIYKNAKAANEYNVALAAQKEIAKLRDLYRAPEIEKADRDPELDAIADHLLPLELAAASYPLSEHARLAADAIREARS